MRIVRDLILIIVMAAAALFPLGAVVPAVAHAQHSHARADLSSSPVDQHHVHQGARQAQAGHDHGSPRDRCKDCLGCCGLTCHAMNCTEIVLLFAPLGHLVERALGEDDGMSPGRNTFIERPPRTAASARG